MTLKLVLATTLALQVAVPAPPAVRPDFPAFLSQLKEQALATGVSAATVDAALTGLEPLAVGLLSDRIGG